MVVTPTGVCHSWTMSKYAFTSLNTEYRLLNFLVLENCLVLEEENQCRMCLLLQLQCSEFRCKNVACGKFVAPFLYMHPCIILIEHNHNCSCHAIVTTASWSSYIVSPDLKMLGNFCWCWGADFMHGNTMQVIHLTIIWRPGHVVEPSNSPFCVMHAYVYQAARFCYGAMQWIQINNSDCNVLNMQDEGVSRTYIVILRVDRPTHKWVELIASVACTNVITF